MTDVQTVRGAIPATGLGVTLMHGHVETIADPSVLVDNPRAILGRQGGY